MVKAMLKSGKMTYVIGLLNMCKFWVKSHGLNLDLIYLNRKLAAGFN